MGDCLERETGVEPATYTLAMCRSSQLNYSRICRDPGSNWGPSVLQTDALPTELSRRQKNDIKYPNLYQLTISLSFS